MFCFVSFWYLNVVLHKLPIVFYNKELLSLSSGRYTGSRLSINILSFEVTFVYFFCAFVHLIRHILENFINISLLFKDDGSCTRSSGVTCNGSQIQMQSRKGN